MGTNYKEELFDKMPIVCIIRNISLEVIEEILPHYKKAGLTTLEITMNSDNACEIIKAVAANHPEINVGAGTVCTMADLMMALDAGATFIVTPIMDVEVMNYCEERNIPIFPGAFTPLEIFNANKLGATAVKIFPATQLGPGYVKDILGPLNTIKLLPTGGVDVHNIQSFFQAGAIGVGMGGSLFDKKLIEAKNYDALYEHFKAICDKVIAIR
ncbi:bifunctional 4-hydroxy-2-oxoglutarate aldolase/2-dehydro-3-deoxy-phosphogluconate aldolase [Flavobacterium sp. 7A]|uniref:bifunctional 4-hydroxy-2-oxoglutarate aldolase/2-dehydro-3-deoxy-phosphogluconate aldolase n=1 Tax=Flavobacterium sp. 7A TaxID=2940571 RepID=UPI002225CB0E|nr:bifunctional 4-hydroxy-2-oxoglutarate aldolase/2-dehydro-3-deoxy-phosphogluconate aldolase [Flavobacterium sp. 7A]MCW2119007.1 2-dehydro-3-deoxyphosphogluconate aldolase/(4S)-4-hydroxy-2-oxoglutarate aldolase [Flavobacterium sp. 7A]